MDKSIVDKKQIEYKKIIMNVLQHFVRHNETLSALISVMQLMNNIPENIFSRLYTFLIPFQCELMLHNYECSGYNFDILRYTITSKTLYFLLCCCC